MEKLEEYSSERSEEKIQHHDYGPRSDLRDKRTEKMQKGGEDLERGGQKERHCFTNPGRPLMFIVQTRDEGPLQKASKNPKKK